MPVVTKVSPPMKLIQCLIVAMLCLCLSKESGAQEATLQGDISVHDPVMIRQGKRYYIFCTGRGISVWSSTDMTAWKKEAPVFADGPHWAKLAVPGFKNHIWAPDISYYRGRYYLYYSVSLFGKNNSCIGLAINKTLDPSSPDYKWEDQGMVLCSSPGITDWNAIDPNLVCDRHGNPWLAFGSFWGGLKIVRLREDGLKLSSQDSLIRPLASRLSHGVNNSKRGVATAVTAGANAIEAPFIFRRGRWYYLLASIDYCCRGVNSTYKMVVGRAPRVDGPYYDRQGRAMMEAGGTILLAGDERWHGCGHCAVCTVDGRDYLVYHAYDAQNNGVPKLRVAMLKWDHSQWPLVQAHD